jgi:uncharacterized NAD(P)/FAD-binding protein YdhS
MYGRTPVVAVVGAGFAGTMTAVHLLRSGVGPLEVVLIERSGRFGTGVAYGTADRQHLLNVPAELMSAFCEQPHHFCEWAQRELGEKEPAAYLPRRSYGKYLQSVLLDAERQAAPGRRLRYVAEEVLDADQAGEGVELDLAGGSRISCQRLVLALGGLGPTRIEWLPADRRIVSDPWAVGGTLEGSAEGPTLVVGMGLTAVDTILSLTANTTGGQVIALSRTGRFPFVHLPGVRTPAPPPELPVGAIDLPALESLVCLHTVDMQSRGYDWRDVIDGLRPVTALLWGRLSEGGRERFLGERMRDWEMRRHRMAPAVAERLSALTAEGRLSTLSGSLVDVEASPRRLSVSVATGDDGDLRQLACSRIVVCAGSSMDVSRSPSPLLQSLLQKGYVTPDALGLGLRATPSGALIDANSGESHGRLFTLGPLRRGELWETTAVGEIRVQARDLALEIGRSLAARRPDQQPQLASG